MVAGLLPKAELSGRLKGQNSDPDSAPLVSMARSESSTLLFYTVTGDFRCRGELKCLF